MDILNIVLIVLVCRCVGETVVNLAFHKPAAMSTMYSTNIGPAGAVDENTGTNFYTETCPTTAHNDREPWWMVDLQGQFRIQSVMLTNRGDSDFYLRLHSFVIEIFTQNPLQRLSAVPEVCANHSEPSLGKSEVRNFTCVCPITGRFVRVRKWKTIRFNDLLTLCDVKVFGKENADNSRQTIFHIKTGTRMTSQTLKPINNVSAIECAVRCLSNEYSEAFNYNLDLHTCELVLDPRFEDEMESDNAWSYYGLDLC